MAWVWLILAGICEMTGVVMINRLHKKKGFLSYAGLAAGFGLSFLFLALAMESLPMGVTYSVWTGIGASGGAILGIVLYKEPADPRRLVFIAIILLSVIGLKLVS